MKIHALLVVAAASLIVGGGVLTAGGEDEAIKKDRKQMAGTWRVISYEKDGKKTPAEQLEKTRSIISGNFTFPVPHDNLDLPANQPMRFEPGPEISTMLPPMVDHDLSGVKLDEVEAAAPGDTPDDAVAIARRQLQQALGRPLQDRLSGVFEDQRSDCRSSGFQESPA